MKIGMVVAPIWATKKCETLTDHNLLVIKSNGQIFVADDLVGAAIGDVVLCNTNGDRPLSAMDATVVAVVDQREEAYECQ